MKCTRQRLIQSCLVAAALGIPARAHAQTSISLADSILRHVAAHSADSVFIELRDGDYANLTVTHLEGLAVDLVSPKGARLRRFNPELQRVHPVAFVAEGAGRYAVVVTNDGD